MNIFLLIVSGIVLETSPHHIDRPTENLLEWMYEMADLFLDTPLTSESRQLYVVIQGVSDETLAEYKGRFDWSVDDVERLQRLRAQWAWVEQVYWELLSKDDVSK